MPTRSDIQHALENPRQQALVVERLGGGWLAIEPGATAAPARGNESVVVRLDRAGGQSIALKVPLADDGDPRSLAIHAAFGVDPVIARLRGASPSPIAGGVSVIPRGVLIPASRGEMQPVPVIAMEWIGDLTLGDVVRRAIVVNDVVRLGTLANRFIRLMQTLGEHRFSHGSLKPDNIVLRTGDAMAIVDYDTAAWPGSPRGRVAQPPGAYRHPSASLPAVVERRDDFAALVLLVSLRALAVDTGMLFPLSLHPEHGLVLSARDLQDPRHSERFRRLAALDDPETVALAAILAEACQKTVDHVPPFDEAVRAAKAVTGRLRRSNQAVSPDVGRTDPVVFVGGLSARDRQLRLTRLNALLLSGADEQAIAFWEESGLGDDPTAIEQAGDLVHEARIRLDLVRNPPPPEPEPPRYDPRREWRLISTGASMARLEQALANGDRVAVLNEWTDVRESPGASRFAAMVHQVANDYWSEAIRFAARQDDASRVLEVVAQADRAGVAIPAGLRPLIRAARERVGEEAHVADETGDHWESRVPLLARAIRDDDDRHIATAVAWEPGHLVEQVPQNVRARIDLALRRIGWADAVRAALRHRPADLDPLMSQTVPGADALLSVTERARIERVIERRQAQQQLTEALAGTSNRDFVRAMRRMEQCAATLPTDLDHRAFTEALDRISRLTALRRAVNEPDQDARAIARLVPAALAQNADWATVERLVNLGDVDRELVRAARVVRIREALATDNDQTIAAAALPDPDDVLKALTEPERARVQTALEAAKPLAGRRSVMADHARPVEADERGPLEVDRWGEAIAPS